MTVSAAQDLMRIHEWISSESPWAADCWLEDIAEDIESLSVFPRRCALAWESSRSGIELRQKTCGDYRILFKVAAQVVYVEHVRHAARLPLDDPRLGHSVEDEVE